MENEKEIEEQLQREMEEDHAQREVFEAELAGSKGQAYPDDPFYGGNADDVKARRQARGAFAREDFETTPENPVDSYVGPARGDQVRTLEELRSFVQYREDLARESHPDYEEIISKYVMPNLKEVDQSEFQQWVLENDDFAEKAYEIGLGKSGGFGTASRRWRKLIN